MHCRDESGGEYRVGVDHDQGGVPEIKSVWRRERERVAEWVIQREREDPSEEESRETFSERNQRHKVSENQRGFRDKRE